MHTKVSCLYWLPPLRSNLNAKVYLTYRVTLNKKGQGYVTLNKKSQGYVTLNKKGQD